MKFIQLHIVSWLKNKFKFFLWPSRFQENEWQSWSRCHEWCLTLIGSISGGCFAEQWPRMLEQISTKPVYPTVPHCFTKKVSFDRRLVQIRIIQAVVNCLIVRTSPYIYIYIYIYIILANLYQLYVYIHYYPDKFIPIMRIYACIHKRIFKDISNLCIILCIID